MHCYRAMRSVFVSTAIVCAVAGCNLLAGKWYVNIHTAAHPGGEIRGQIILRE